MHSDSSASSRASSPDMDDMFIREHHHHHHHHLGSSVSSSTQSGQKTGGGGDQHLSSRSSSSSSDKDKSSGGSNKYKLKKQVTEQEVQTLRLKINGRERKRMHDLNLAMDGLREVMPYAHGPSVRKLSKIATLLLARNYILMLNSSLDEMKRLVGEIYGGGHHSAFHCGTGGAAGSPGVHHHPAVHPLLGGALSSSSAGSALPGLASIRAAPHHHSLMKSASAPPGLGTGGFPHWAGVGLPCPCAICQVPPPPPHIPISAGLTRLTAETFSEKAMKDVLK